ncbi:hypothetical protein Lupro_10755 [Lutibacter profundi]|uniref:Uncharacterized protein n=1 Tax=Lutibacter profundi TaxID=1622118 RepID=A0A0X8G808_9FLAO|nr:hypothetical protein [Lutibacter profundi]AMC11718.1 hypothetical protein Lupro_10755 [Lutibacter profundi]
MNTYKNQSFLKLTIRFGLVFLVIVSAIKIIISIFNHSGIDGMMDEYFSPNGFEQFAKTQVLMSALYGAFMAGYYRFIKK